MGASKNGKGQGPDMDGDPGAGGVTRGRADAEMTWGEESQGRTDLFQPKLLDPSAPPDPKDSEKLGVSATTPEARAERESSTAADTKASPGTAAWRRRLAPHHRDAVKSYFSQEKQK
jgi:hypothetical protein